MLQRLLILTIIFTSSLLNAGTALILCEHAMGNFPTVSKTNPTELRNQPPPRKVSHNSLGYPVYKPGTLKSITYGESDILEHREVTNNEKKLMPKPFQNSYDLALAKNAKNVFVTAGVNTTEKIALVNSISGIGVEDLTYLAMPTGGTTGLPRSSDTGYIKHDQNIRDILIRDNQIVVDQLKLTHQKISEPLIQIIKFVNDYFYEETNDIGGALFPGRLSKRNLTKRDFEVALDTKTYHVRLRRLGGTNNFTRAIFESGWMPGNTQGSIFGDNIFSNYALEITNSKGDSIVIDTVTPHMIYRYGFYQGGQYRIAPERLAEFFQITR